MTPSSIPALLGLVLLTVLVSRLEARIDPAWKARTLAVLVVATLAGAGVFLTLTVTTFYVELLPAPVRDANPILALIARHGVEVPVFVGVPLSFALGWVAWRAGAFWRDTRRETRATRDAGVVESPEAFAYAVPQGGGRIVVSSSLVSLLAKDEVRAVYLHEQAHLDAKHHRFIFLTGLLAAVCPPLVSVHAAMRFTLERWADEDAARQLDDRPLVARSLAKVALAGAGRGPGTALGFAEHHTAMRVERLLRPDAAPRAGHGTALFGVTGGLAGYMSGGPLQVYHLLPLLAL